MRTWRVKADTYTRERFLTDHRNRERLWFRPGDDLEVETTCFYDGSLAGDLADVTFSLHDASGAILMSDQDLTLGTPTLSTFKAGTAEHGNHSFADTVTTLIAPGLYTAVITGVDTSANVITFATGLVEAVFPGA